MPSVHNKTDKDSIQKPRDTKLKYKTEQIAYREVNGDITAEAETQKQSNNVKLIRNALFHLENFGYQKYRNINRQKLNQYHFQS